MEKSDAYVFYGIVPHDDRDQKVRLETQGSVVVPWRVRVPKNFRYKSADVGKIPSDPIAALDIALGVGTQEHTMRTLARNKCPVRLLEYGDDRRRFALAICASVTVAPQWEVCRVPFTAACPSGESKPEQWPSILGDFANRLGIPHELRGEPGWFAFAWCEP